MSDKKPLVIKDGLKGDDFKPLGLVPDHVRFKDRLPVDDEQKPKK